MARIKTALRIAVFVLAAALIVLYLAVALAALVAVSDGSTAFGMWTFRLASAHTAYFFVGVVLLNLVVVAGSILSARRSKGRAKSPRPGDTVRARVAKRRPARSLAMRFAERRR